MRVICIGLEQKIEGSVTVRRLFGREIGIKGQSALEIQQES